MSSENRCNNFLDLCRLCLTKDQTLLPIFDPLQDSPNESDILEKIAICIPIRIKKEDSLSKQIYEDCSSKVEEFYEFRKKTVDCQRILENLLQNSRKDSDQADSGNIYVSIQNLDNLEVSSDLTNDSSVKIEFEDNELIGSVEEVNSDVSEENEDVSDGEEIERNSQDNISDNIQEFEHLVILDRNLSSPTVILNSEEDPLNGCTENEIDNGNSISEILSSTNSENHPKNTSKSTNDSLKSIATKSKDYHCEICLKKLKTSTQFSRHIAKHKIYTCSACPYTSRSANNFKLHMMKHNGEYLITCNVCGKGFYKKQYFRDHFISKHSNEITEYNCSVCHKTFNSKNYLNLHLKCHSPNYNKEQYQCDICGKIFKSWNGLRCHKLSIHEGCRYKCDECGKEVTSIRSLKNHKMSHNNRKSFICDICGKGFIAFNNLIVHQRIHRNERPYKCDACDKYFTQKCSLDLHKKYHKGDKPFQCLVCNKRFVSILILKSHEKNHK